MPRKYHAQVEEYPEDLSNIFHDYKDYDSLDSKYHSYVRKNGTNEWLNNQYILRKKELDMIAWLEFQHNK